MRGKNDDVSFEIYSELYNIGNKKLYKFAYKTIFDFFNEQYHIKTFWKQEKIRWLYREACLKGRLQ